MKKSYPPIFLSGPHGGGKSTLISRLTEGSNLFIENDFDIDFTVDFPSIVSLSQFERSLMRLYHRYFITRYAEAMAAAHPTHIVLTNRTVYDSEAYINTYHAMGWITEHQFKKMDFVLKNFLYRPHAIVLNPPFDVVERRLAKRQRAATRKNRDAIFQNEDTSAFLRNLCNYFTRFKGQKNILYIEDNSDKEIKKIIAWARSLQMP